MEKRFEKYVVLVVLVNVASIDVHVKKLPNALKIICFMSFSNLFFFLPNVLTTVSLLVLLDVVEDSSVRVNF